MLVSRGGSGDLGGAIPIPLREPLPEGGPAPAVTENLGEQMMGDVIETSAYKINMLEDKPCELLCKVTLKKEEKDLPLLLAEIQRFVSNVQR
eukprot:Skav230201  [mRNA]  locus=scaffold2443:63172:64894:+ [translate_table: standard]